MCQRLTGDLLFPSFVVVHGVIIGPAPSLDRLMTTTSAESRSSAPCQAGTSTVGDTTTVLGFKTSRDKTDEPAILERGPHSGSKFSHAVSDHRTPVSSGGRRSSGFPRMINCCRSSVVDPTVQLSPSESKHTHGSIGYASKVIQK